MTAIETSPRSGSVVSVELPRSVGRPHLPVVLALVALCALGVGVPVVHALASGAWGVPHVDDWAYGDVALRLSRTGQLHLAGWGVMTLVGQIVLVQPLLALSQGFGALHAFGALAGTACIILAFVVARPLVGDRRGLIVAGLFAVSPAVVSVDTTFLTDLPSLALELAAIAFLQRCVRARRRASAWLFAALGATAVAFTIRETAAAVFGVIVVTMWLRPPPHVNRRVAAAASCVCAVSMALFYLWRSGLPLSQRTLFFPGSIAAGGSQLCFELGVALVPVTACFLTVRRGRSAIGLAVGIGAAILLATVALSAGGLLPSGSPSSTGPEGGFMGGVAQPVLPPGVWVALKVAAVVSVAVLACELASRRRPVRTWHLDTQRLMIVIDLILGGVLLLATVSQGFLSSGVSTSRYVLPLIVPAAILVVSLIPADPVGRLSLPHRSILLVVCTLLTLISWSQSFAADDYLAASWHEGDALVAAGYQPSQVESGFEWYADHQRSPPAVPAFPMAASDADQWDRLWATIPCAIVSTSPLTPRRGLRFRDLDVWSGLLGAQMTFYVYDQSCAGSTPDNAASG